MLEERIKELKEASERLEVLSHDEITEVTGLSEKKIKELE